MFVSPDLKPPDGMARRKDHRVVRFCKVALRCSSILLVLGAGCAPVGAPIHSGQVQHAGAQSRLCVIDDVSQQPVMVEGGRHVYIEPTALSVASDGSVLLAGAPTYLWSRSPDASGSYGVSRDSILGVAISPDGITSSVPAPVDAARIRGIRVLARTNGAWEVVFAEVAGSGTHPPPDSIVRLWHGTYDGQRWLALEEIPFPGVGRPLASGASNLVLRGDTLVWATQVVLPNRRRSTAVFERGPSGWSSEMIPAAAAYVRLADADSLGLTLALVQSYVPEEERPGTDSNSLLLYVRDPSWRMLRRVVRGGEQPVHDPSLSLAGGPDVLTWWSPVADSTGHRQEARAMVGDLEKENPPVVALDSAVAQVIPLQGRGGEIFWVTSHVDSDTPDEIRFLQRKNGEAVLLGSIRNPFEGPFNAVLEDASTLLLVGPRTDRGGRGPFLVSLAARARLSCS